MLRRPKHSTIEVVAPKKEEEESIGCTIYFQFILVINIYIFDVILTVHRR